MRARGWRLLFDVFGTCVDWPSSIIREGEALARRLGLGKVDWPAFADAWRGLYQPRIETVRSGRRPWANLDVLHRESLDRALAEFGLEAVAEADRAGLTLAWHRLDPPEVYTRSVEALGLRPGQAMMVAAHNPDLEAAAALGLRTAFVRRPAEHGPGQTTDLEPGPAAEVVASDLVGLAGKLGA